MNFSVAEENYLKAIYHLQTSDDNVTTNDVAAHINTKPASVTDMLKKLKAKKLVNYEKYQGFKLTAEGKKVALTIIRKHRLWEYFLVEKLKFGWDEVHEVAEELEHISSKKLIDSIDAFLGFPKFDPHGDPIPDANGTLPVRQNIPLVEIPVNKNVQVVAITDQSSALLDIITHKKIQLGTRFLVKKKFGFDDSIEIKIKNEEVTMLSSQLAQAILVKLI